MRRIDPGAIEGAGDAFQQRFTVAVEVVSNVGIDVDVKVPTVGV